MDSTRHHNKSDHYILYTKYPIESDVESVLTTNPIFMIK